jgi:hypothetical protein
MGKKNREMMIREWVGPRCSRPSIRKSMSGMTEATNNKGMFELTFRSLEVVLPVRYPKARCPTANVCFPLLMFVGHFSEVVKLSVLLSFGLVFSYEGGCGEGCG